MYILPALLTTVVKEAEEQSTRTYASVTEEAQESLGLECFEKSSAVVGVKDMQKIEDDIVEQDRCKYNVIKYNVSKLFAM